jgi:hypothetical protein
MTTLNTDNIHMTEEARAAYQQFIATHAITSIHEELATEGRCMDCDGKIAKYHAYAETPLFTGDDGEEHRESVYLGIRWDNCSCSVR